MTTNIQTLKEKLIDGELTDFRTIFGNGASPNSPLRQAMKAREVRVFKNKPFIASVKAHPGTHGDYYVDNRVSEVAYTWDEAKPVMTVITAFLKPFTIARNQSQAIHTLLPSDQKNIIRRAFEADFGGVKIVPLSNRVSSTLENLASCASSNCANRYYPRFGETYQAQLSQVHEQRVADTVKHAAKRGETLVVAIGDAVDNRYLKPMHDLYYDKVKQLWCEIPVLKFGDTSTTRGHPKTPQGANGGFSIPEGAYVSDIEFYTRNSDLTVELDEVARVAQHLHAEAADWREEELERLQTAMELAEEEANALNAAELKYFEFYQDIEAIV